MIKEKLYQYGIISIVRGPFLVDEIVRMGEALLKGGVRCIEVTLNSPHALAGIPALREAFDGEMFVGAGTVRTAEDVEQAVDAGSRYLIAPCLDLDAVKAAQRHGVMIIPGIFTPSEAQAAYRAGCETVKLFPAGPLGPNYLKAVRAPLDHIDFVPTGGVNFETIAAFHKAGAVAYGVGSALIKNEEINTPSLNALTARANALVEALQRAR